MEPDCECPFVVLLRCGKIPKSADDCFRRVVKALASDILYGCLIRGDKLNDRISCDSVGK
jgi:hypothetical protein